MKKLAVFVGALVLCGVGAGWAASEYRHELFDAAIEIERQKAQLTEKVINVDGMDISYLEGPRVEGQESIVLVHGFAAIKENWLRMAGHLTSDYHVVALDMPGHGKSSQDLSRMYTIDVQADNLNKIAEALDIERFHIAGNSMGGAISSIYSARYPQKIATVTLYDPAGIFDFEAPLQAALREGNNPLIVKDAKSFDELVDFAMEKPPLIPWPLSAAAAERSMTRQTINEKIFSDISNHTRYNFKEEITQIKAPVQIIWGTEDRIIHVGNADVFDQLIPNSTKNIYQGIGHAPMMEVPERSADDMRQFIIKNG